MAVSANRSLTTESTEATEAGRKGFRIRIRTLLSFPSVSVNSVLSVVKSGLDIVASWHHIVFMGAAVRTTLHLDGDVYRAARSLAAARGRGLGAVISDLARKGLTAPLPASRTQHGFPTFDVPANAAPITAEMVQSAFEDE
jgi:hypothetical protein